MRRIEGCSGRVGENSAEMAVDAMNRLRCESLSVLSAAPNDPHARKIYAYCELVLAARAEVAAGGHDEADWLLTRAIELIPNNPTALIERCDLSFSRLHFDEAVRLARCVLTLDPNSLAAVERLALLLPFIGRDAEAELLLRTKLSARFGDPLPLVPTLARILVQAGKPDDAVVLVESVPHRNALPPLAFEELEWSYGHALLAIGRIDDAFCAFKRMHAVRGGHFDVHGFKRLASLLVSRHREAVRDVDDSELANSELPVFVCALPRSGTTIFERLLVAHDKCFSTGERDLFTMVLRQNYVHSADSTDGLLLKLADFKVRERIRACLLTRLRGMAPNALRVLDKSVNNWLRIEAIGVLFPRARIVVLKRSAADLGLSIWAAALDPLQHPYASRLDWIGCIIESFERIVTQLGVVGPNPTRVITYEDLVLSRRVTVLGVLEFLGLDWDERCLNPLAVDPKTKIFGPPTKGHLQASRPITSSAVGRAGAFGSRLRALYSSVERRPGETNNSEGAAGTDLGP